MSTNITIATTTDALDAAAEMLRHSLSRGDFDADSDFEDAASLTLGRLEEASAVADVSDETEVAAEVVVNSVVLDEVLGVLESDTNAKVGALGRFIADATDALDAS